MDTSDDPLTAMALAGAGMMVAGAMDKKDDYADTQSVIDMRTTETINERGLMNKDYLSDLNKKKKMAGSLMVRKWDDPILGQPGLLGIV